MIMFVDVTKPVIPSSEVGPALDAACRSCCAATADDFVVKAMVPPIFLALGILCNKFSSDSGLSGVTIAIQAATLPVAAGLGSSAALSVATAAALLELYFILDKRSIIDVEQSPVEIDDARFGVGKHPVEALRPLINDWAFCAETLFHGNPSGLDNTVSTFVAASRCHAGMSCHQVVVWCAGSEMHSST
jgi:mevalonate kinase